jgi:hypothetical protein
MVNIGRRLASLSVHGFKEPHYVLCPLFVRISFAPPSIIAPGPSSKRKLSAHCGTQAIV